MARKKGIIREIEERSDSFAIMFAVFFFLTFGFLTFVGATPDKPGDSGDSSSNTTSIFQPPSANPSPGPSPTSNPTPAYAPTPSAPPTSQSSVGGIQAPVKITIKKIGLTANISNPDSTDVDELDKELLKGAVRYPTSATLGVDGTMLLFGHSSYLPIVHNQAYKAFDGIQNLKEGDIISVYSSDTEYQYTVTSVRVADATTDVIQLPQDGRHLTLVTCDSFASKSNRFVVTADYSNAYSR